MSTDNNDQCMEINPYEGHPELTQLEAQVLWEYAKFAKQVKQLLTITRQLSNAPDETMLKKMRELERKFGFVLTLVRVTLKSFGTWNAEEMMSFQFKASVWAAINDKQTAQEEEEDEEEESYGDQTYEQTITR
ncbi:hypothetical protein Clacol_006561 [Clathrus columnatus]|uniref:DASH complex subunit DAD3 n=1 Tax=Clathrus columnatus TaxID=1419009 RepID=A0AAV5AHG0_9AGAM|nr:hypothetical protein Clacol_006561 [Clathrus columnatus]